MDTERPLPTRRAPVRRPAWVPKLALLVGSIALAVTGAEVAVRLILPVGLAEIEWGAVRLSANRTLMYELQPGASDHNRWGLRGAETTRQKPAGVFRVAMLGDSLIYGLHLAVDETIPNRLEGLLDESVAGVEVFNFGVPGYGIIQEAEQARVLVPRFEPDLAVLVVCLNDWDAFTLELQALLAIQESRTRFLSLFDRPDVSRLRRLLYRSHLVRLTEYQIRRRVSGQVREWGRYQLGPDGTPPVGGSQALSRNADRSFYPAHFARLSRALTTAGIPLLVMLAPWNLEGGDAQYAGRLAELRELCREPQCTLVDFLATVTRDSERRDWFEEAYGEDRIHFTPTGATAVARFLGPHVERFRSPEP